MNAKSKKTPLLLLVTILGIAALAARFVLYLTATDEKGLLTQNHPLTLVLWVLTAAAAAITVFFVRKLGGAYSYEANYPASRGAAVGCLLFAAGILIAVLVNRNGNAPSEIARNVLGLLAVPALAGLAVCRWKGNRPHFAFHTIICLFLLLYTISHYALWSSYTQLQNAAFPMLGSILLLLFAYHQAAFDVELGNRRMVLGCGCMAVFACLAAFPFCPDPPLYLTGAVWAATNLCSRAPVEAAE